MTKRVAIIGAGPAGITAAYELAKAGVHVSVFEASPQVGGLARTITLWDQKVDLGPHRFFSKDPRINRLWREVIREDYEMVDRLTRIHYRDRFFYYPLRPFNVFRQLGALEAARCVLSYVAEKLHPKRDLQSFESWTTNRFGRRLFEIFFKSYSEKLWGIACSELDADFAAQRIKQLNLFEAVKNAFSRGGEAKHKTLVDQFAYPNGGSGFVYERMAECVKRLGGAVYLSTPVKRVIARGGVVRGIELANRRILPFDDVISTMPVSLLVNSLPEAPATIKSLAQQLRFRNTILVYLNVQSENLFPDNWIYVHSPELRVGRITNYRNWGRKHGCKAGHSVLSLEYWCYDDEPMWTMSDSELVAFARSEIIRTGLSGEAAIIDGAVQRIKRCYPVYELGYRRILAPIERYLSSVKGLQTIGRYGSFKYNNQDHSILMGLLAAENVLSGAKKNSWEVNYDDDSYQESLPIAATGLIADHRENA